MNPKALLQEVGAYLNGHFLLTSGLHSDTYVEKFRILEDPERTALLCRDLAEAFREERPEVVLGPATGGIIMAQWVAYHLGLRAIFTERENGKMALRRGFCLRPGERVLLVEDVVTTGGSVHEVLEIVREQGAEVVGVGALVDRSGGKAEFGTAFKALLQVNAEAWQPADCPLCQQGAPFTERGSRGRKS